MAASSTPPVGSDDGDGPGTISEADREVIKKRAEDLGRRLEAAKGHGENTDRRSQPSPGESAANADALGKAMRISTELVGGVVVGCGLGWAADWVFGTWPAFFIVFFMLGAAAGMVNVVRAGMAMKTGPDAPNAGPAVRDDDRDD